MIKFVRAYARELFALAWILALVAGLGAVAIHYLSRVGLDVPHAPIWIVFGMVVILAPAGRFIKEDEL